MSPALLSLLAGQLVETCRVPNLCSANPMGCRTLKFHRVHGTILA